MKKVIFSFMLFLPFCSFADTLTLVFRYYDAQGHLVAGSNLKVESSSNYTRTVSTDEDAWQEVSWVRNNLSDVLRLKSASDSLDLQVEIMAKYQERVKILVIDRLQGGQAKQSIKVNHLTCKFKGSIASPLEYRFINPLDLRLLLPDSISTYEKGLQVLSDSVMLLRCDKGQGVFIKYFLGIDGTLDLVPSPVECSSFKNGQTRKLYNFIKNHSAFTFRIENNYFIIKSGFDEMRLLISG